MKRVRFVWPLFVLCLAAAGAGMAWISLTALRLDRAEAEAVRRADFQERVRLALWRLDSAMMPLIVQESTRPYYAYSPFHPVEQAYDRLNQDYAAGDVVQASELLTFESERVLDAVDRLAKLRSIIESRSLLGMLPDDVPPEPDPLNRELPNPVAVGQRLRQQKAPQEQFDINEYAYRNLTANQAQFRGQVGNSIGVRFVSRRGSDVGKGAFHAVWLAEELLLARRVRVKGKEFVQGCWLNWPHLRDWLLAGVGDLLPEAGLVPLGPGECGGGSSELASLPVSLLPGRAPEGAGRPASSVRLVLLIAWSCVGLGAMAVGLVLSQALRLSRRRGAFVSAVTHELRTPLTTFRLYSEMLAEGMVLGAEKREKYLRRLREEGDRLSHLVENVLAHARLTGPRSAARLESIRLGDLLDRVGDRLCVRIEQGGMTPVLAAADEARRRTVRADVAAVTQILLNLVDNACKYAARASDRRIHVQAELAGANGAIRVWDHGPGIADGEAGGLFREFAKSAHAAAESAPGIGLGLALSRRLARNMAGDLRHEPTDRDGARFVLTLRTT